MAYNLLVAKITAIIFDLGKVVFDLSFDLVFESWATSSGKQFSDIKNKFQFDELFDKFETGEISPEKYRSLISRRLNIQLTNEEFDQGWCDLYLDPYNEIEQLLLDLKHKYRLVALTNTNIIHNKVWRLKYAGILKHFEKIFSSHEMETRKPEEKAYGIVLNYLQCKPSETIFIDDNADNIMGANKLGIKTILVTSQEQMRKELQKLKLLN